MVIHKMWRVKDRKNGYTTGEVWHREGWFLFGFIPLYVKTTRHEYLA